MLREQDSENSEDISSGGQQNDRLEHRAVRESSIVEEVNLRTWKLKALFASVVSVFAWLLTQTSTLFWQIEKAVNCKVWRNTGMALDEVENNAKWNVHRSSMWIQE